MADAIQAEIINTGLALLGEEPVVDLEEGSLQSSLAASKLMRHIEPARATILRRHGWLCALEYDTLTPVLLEGYRNWRYPTVFQLPATCLRVWEIGGVTFNGSEISCWEPRWQTGTFETGDGSRQILRARDATATLNVAYVRLANWTSLDAHIADAIAHETAARGAFSVSGDRALAKDLRAQAEAKVLMAISVDGTQEGGQPPWASSIPAQIRNGAR